MAFKPVKLPSGKWRIRWYDYNGRRCSEAFATEASARAALRRHEVEVSDVRSGRVMPRAMMTVAAAAKEWLEARPARRRADNESHLVHHILPALGDKALAHVTPDVLERFVRGLEGKRTARPGELNQDGRKLSPATIKNVLITLGKLMKDMGHEVRVKYVVPTSGYNWIRDRGEVVRFLEACGDGWFRMAAELAVYAGLRKGEIGGLRRDALDFERGLIRIDRSYEGPTKSKHVRWAPIAPGLASRLKAWPWRILVSSWCALTTAAR